MNFGMMKMLLDRRTESRFGSYVALLLVELLGSRYTHELSR